MLHAAQQQVRELFERYGTHVTEPQQHAKREQLRERIRASLHALLDAEDRLIYPRLQPLVDATNLQAARDDHQRITQQLQRTGTCEPGAPLDAAMTDLAQLTLAHLAFENERMIDALARIDTPALHAQVRAALGDGSG